MSLRDFRRNMSAVSTQYFSENIMNDHLLLQIGMEDSASRDKLIGYFKSVLPLARADIFSSFSEFIQCLVSRLSDLEESRTVARQLQSHLDTLQRNLDSSTSALESLAAKERLSAQRADELGVINKQMQEGLDAYRSKIEEKRQALAEKDQTIHSLRSDMDSYDARLAKCLAEVSVAETHHAERLKAVETNFANRLKATEKKMSYRCKKAQNWLVQRLEYFRREMQKVRGDWATWSKHQIGRQRCGCPALIRYFEKKKIDVEWVTALEETADNMRTQLQAVCVERDDALADCALYIDRLLCAEDAQRKSGLEIAALMGEYSVVRAELFRRSGVERSMLRAQLFAVGGRELVFPVPTVDGEFVSLTDVYRGWMDGGQAGEGISLQFKSPFTGKSFIFLLVVC